MSAVPIHGGGITLHRVLGKDLERFDWYLETVRYASEPRQAREGARCHAYPWWSFEVPLRRWVGSRIACRVTFSRWSRSVFARQVATGFSEREDLSEVRLLACPQSDITLRVIEQWRRRFPKMRYVTWMMDDHLLKWKGGKWVYTYGAEQLMARHLNAAEKVYVISPALQAFYAQRFGVESSVLCSPAEAAESSSVSTEEFALPRLAYFGSLGPWQNDAISLLAPFIRAGTIALDLYTRDKNSVPPELLEAGARFCESVAPEAIAKRASLYDALVLPVSFAEERRNMSFFNIATKFSECLAASVPTLLIGPSDSAMVRMARSAGACIVMDDPVDRRGMEVAIEVLKDPALCSQVKSAERTLLASVLSRETMIGRWQEGRRFLFDGLS